MKTFAKFQACQAVDHAAINMVTGHCTLTLAWGGLIYIAFQDKNWRKKRTCVAQGQICPDSVSFEMVDAQKINVSTRGRGVALPQVALRSV